MFLFCLLFLLSEILSLSLSLSLSQFYFLTFCVASCYFVLKILFKTNKIVVNLKEEGGRKGEGKQEEEEEERIPR